MRQFFIGFLIIAGLLVGGSVVASVAYQVGVSTAVTTVAADAPPGTIVTPVAPGVMPGYGYGYGYGPGWGWHGGFGIGGFLVGLFFLFLFFGLLRAAFGRGRGWGGRSGYGGGWGGHDHGGERPWERQAREVHDAWHRRADGQSARSGPSGTTGGNPPTGGPSTGGTAG